MTLLETDKTLAAEYVLGTLESDERNRFAARVSAEPELQREVLFWEKHFASFADDVAPVTPPARVQAGIQSRLFGAAEKPGLWNRLALWRGLALASLAALVLVVALPRFMPQKFMQQSVAQLAAENSPVKLAAVFDASHNAIRYSRLAGAPADGRDFELWAIVGNDPPVSLGVIPAGDNGIIPVSATLAVRIATATLAISDEPKGGSPTGQPTGAVLAAGKLTPI